jgi:ABC-type phosphate transport system substrate-binding protein
MRTSFAGAAVLIAGVGAASLAAALTVTDTTGDGLALNGSDTLFDVTQSIIGACPGQFSDFATHGISYLGGGSGVGAGQMDTGAQMISPMSRALKSSEYCAIGSPSSPGLTEDLLVGIDGVAISANQTTSCSAASGSANGVGSAAAFAVTADGTATGGAPATCPGCDASNTYTFGAGGSALYSGQPSFDALAVLYFGLTHDGTYNCASPVRKSLIKNWKNLFSSDCAAGDSTCTAGLTHAWRRSDLSGTTDAFVSVLNPPGGSATNGKGAGVSVGIGTLSTVPAAFQSKKSNPFCNSADANPAAGAAAAVSFGGSADFSDLDPVRTNCAAGDNVCQGFKSFASNGGSFAGDLGVVLPILIPDSTSTLTSDLYPSSACTTQCIPVAPYKGNQAAFFPGFLCPNGSPPVGGVCFMPFAGSPTAPDPRCVVTNTQTKCGDVASGKPDGRRYNLVTVVASSQVPTSDRTGNFEFAIDANKRILNGDFFRVHELTAAANNVPNPSAGTTGLCKENDDTSQIGCLTDSDPCSVGYAGREAAKSYPGTGSPATPQSAPLKALSVNGTPPFTPGADPDAALKNLLAAPGTTPLYPLARRLYVGTIYGFSNLAGGENELMQCYGNNSVVGPAITSHGFVAVPGGVQCLDYPEELSTTSTPAPNVQGPGNVALGGCGAGLTGQNACAVSPPVITN